MRHQRQIYMMSMGQFFLFWLEPSIFLCKCSQTEYVNSTIDMEAYILLNHRSLLSIIFLSTGLDFSTVEITPTIIYKYISWFTVISGAFSPFSFEYRGGGIFSLLLSAMPSAQRLNNVDYTPWKRLFSAATWFGAAPVEDLASLNTKVFTPVFKKRLSVKPVGV